MAASEGVGGVDVAVARDAEGGGVGLTGDASRSLLADLAHPDALVAGRQLVGAVDLGVASYAEEGGVGSTEENGGGGFAGVAGLGGEGPSCRRRGERLAVRFLESPHLR